MIVSSINCNDNKNELKNTDSIGEKMKKPEAVKPKRISYQEFQQITKNQIKEVLYEDTDYNAYALEIAKQIEKGNFKIKSYKDFIGLMFAIYIFGLSIDDLKQFLLKSLHTSEVHNSYYKT